jgi:methylenetetrahydrofolate reductase (NADPH)
VRWVILKTFESPSLLRRDFKEKSLTVALITWLPKCFDNAKYFDFVAKAREIGITVPIIPGIKPLRYRHLQILPQIFRIDLLEDLIDAVDKCKTNADVSGDIQQSRELKAAGVPVCIIRW